MVTQRRLEFVRGQVAWMVGTALVLTGTGLFSYERFFVVSLIGFLVVVELTAPYEVRPEWREHLAWIGLAGVVGLSFVVFVRRILPVVWPIVAPS